MSLNWNLNKIENYKELCYRDTEEGVELHPVTNTLIWGGLSIGYGSITKKNIETLASRYSIYEKLFGCFVRMNDGTDRPITEEDLENHLGLSTNCDDYTDAKFLKKVWQRVTEEASRKKHTEGNGTI